MLNISRCRKQSDVDEALRLMRMSKISLLDEEGGRGSTDVVSAIYSRIRDDASRSKQATYTWPQLTALLTGMDCTVCPRVPSPLLCHIVYVQCMVVHCDTISTDAVCTCMPRLAGCKGLQLYEPGMYCLPSALACRTLSVLTAACLIQRAGDH